MHPHLDPRDVPEGERELHSPSAVSSRAPARPPALPSRMPHLSVPGAELDPRQFVEPHTHTALTLSALIAVLMIVCLILSRAGIFVVLAMAGVQYLAMRRATTILKGSALRVGPRQFPEIHACVAAHAERLALADAPDVYVIDAAEVNGFALRLGRRNGIFLTDEAVAACLEGKSPGALSFVIGHELAHIALGHQQWWRRSLAQLHWLSRLDECSADNVACELAGSSEAAQDGVLLLAAGPRLLSFVDREAALAQAAEVAGDKASRRAERSLTHPLTLRRLHRVAGRFEPARLRRAA